MSEDAMQLPIFPKSHYLGLIRLIFFPLCPSRLLLRSISRLKRMGKELHWLFREHTSILGRSTAGTGARKWQCNYCGKVQTSNLTRLREHMHGVPTKKKGRCLVIPKDIVKKIHEKLGSSSSFEDAEAVADNADLAEQDHANRDDRDPAGRDMTVKEHLFKKMKQGKLTKASWQNAHKKQARIEVRRCLIMCNLSFNVLRTKQWKKMISVVAQIGTSWKGVGYNTMRQAELDKEIEAVNEELNPIKEKWIKYGCSIITDGWKDRRRRHIMNIMISSCMGTIFHRAID